MSIGDDDLSRTGELPFPYRYYETGAMDSYELKTDSSFLIFRASLGLEFIQFLGFLFCGAAGSMIT